MPRVSDRAGSRAGLALSSGGVSPSADSESVGTPEHVYFAAQYLACGYPCQRFSAALASVTT